MIFLTIVAACAPSLTGTGDGAACWTVAADGDDVALLAFDFAGEDVWEEARYHGPSTPAPEAGLAFDDGAFLFGDDASFWRAPLGTDELETCALPVAAAVAHDGADFVTLDAGRLRTWHDFGALSDGTVGSEVQTTLQAARIEVADGYIFGAQLAGGDIYVHNMDDGKWDRTLELDGVDGWVDGVSIVGRSLFLLEAGGDTLSVGRYDLQSGALLDEIVLDGAVTSGSPSGLHCVTGAD